MTAAALFSFWAFSMMFVLTPGADWAYAMSAGIRGRYIFSAVFGLLLGYVVLTAIVAAGIGILISGNHLLMLLLATGGALYLIWLGIGMLRNPLVRWQRTTPLRMRAGIKLLLQGSLVSGLNPKAFMFFLAFLPPFTTATASWSMPIQLFALGMIHTMSCSVVYLLVGIGARLVLSARPAAARFVGRLSGVIMLGLGIFLIYRQITSG